MMRFKKIGKELTDRESIFRNKEKWVELLTNIDPPNGEECWTEMRIFTYLNATRLCFFYCPL